MAIVDDILRIVDRATQRAAMAAVSLAERRAKKSYSGLVANPVSADDQGLRILEEPKERPDRRVRRPKHPPGVPMGGNAQADNPALYILRTGNDPIGKQGFTHEHDGWMRHPVRVKDHEKYFSEHGAGADAEAGAGGKMRADEAAFRRPITPKLLAALRADELVPRPTGKLTAAYKRSTAERIDEDDEDGMDELKWLFGSLNYGMLTPDGKVQIDGEHNWILNTVLDSYGLHPVKNPSVSEDNAAYNAPLDAGWIMEVTDSGRGGQGWRVIDLGEHTLKRLSERVQQIEQEFKKRLPEDWAGFWFSIDAGRIGERGQSFHFKGADLDRFGSLRTLLRRMPARNVKLAVVEKQGFTHEHDSYPRHPVRVKDHARYLSEHGGVGAGNTPNLDAAIRSFAIAAESGPTGGRRGLVQAWKRYPEEAAKIKQRARAKLDELFPGDDTVTAYHVTRREYWREGSFVDGFDPFTSFSLDHAAVEQVAEDFDIDEPLYFEVEVPKDFVATFYAAEPELFTHEGMPADYQKEIIFDRGVQLERVRVTHKLQKQGFTHEHDQWARHPIRVKDHAKYFEHSKGGDFETERAERALAAGDIRVEQGPTKGSSWISPDGKRLVTGQYLSHTRMLSFMAQAGLIEGDPEDLTSLARRIPMYADGWVEEYIGHHGNVNVGAVTPAIIAAELDRVVETQDPRALVWAAQGAGAFVGTPEKDWHFDMRSWKRMRSVEDPEQRLEAAQNLTVELRRHVSQEKVEKHDEGGGGVAIGVLLDDDGNVVAGKRTDEKRHNLHVLPGGHIAAGETPAQGAAREFEEEVGIPVRVVRPLAQQNGDTGHRLHFFLLEATTSQPPRDTKELYGVRYYDPDSVKLYPKNREVVELGRQSAVGKQILSHAHDERARHLVIEKHPGDHDQDVHDPRKRKGSAGVRVKIPKGMRKVVLGEEPVCSFCGTAEGPMDVDHKIPVKMGGKNVKINLQPACQSCNRARGAKDQSQKLEWVKHSMDQVREIMRQAVASGAMAGGQQAATLTHSHDGMARHSVLMKHVEKAPGISGSGSEPGTPLHVIGVEDGEDDVRKHDTPDSPHKEHGPKAWGGKQGPVSSMHTEVGERWPTLAPYLSDVRDVNLQFILDEDEGPEFLGLLRDYVDLAEERIDDRRLTKTVKQLAGLVRDEARRSGRWDEKATKFKGALEELATELGTAVHGDRRAKALAFDKTMTMAHRFVPFLLPTIYGFETEGGEEVMMAVLDGLFEDRRGGVTMKKMLNRGTSGQRRMARRLMRGRIRGANAELVAALEEIDKLMRKDIGGVGDTMTGADVHTDTAGSGRRAKRQRRE